MHRTEKTQRRGSLNAKHVSVSPEILDMIQTDWFYLEHILVNIFRHWIHRMERLYSIIKCKCHHCERISVSWWTQGDHSVWQVRNNKYLFGENCAAIASPLCCILWCVCTVMLGAVGGKQAAGHTCKSPAYAIGVGLRSWWSFYIWTVPDEQKKVLKSDIS